MRRLGWLALAAALGSGAWWQWDQPHGEAAPQPAVQAAAVAKPASAEPIGPGKVQPVAMGHVDRLWQSGSLRGTVADGDWGRWVAGELQPSASLRRRFDYLLTGIGEVAPTELRDWIDNAVRRDHGEAGAAQVLAVWDRYLGLLQRPLASSKGGQACLPALLAEQASQRRAAMGAAWAETFFGEEQRAAAQVMTASCDGPPPTADATAAIEPELLSPAIDRMNDSERELLQQSRIAHLGAAAAERLRAADEAWADWQRRLALARDALKAIDAAPELSAPQRDDARADYLRQHFDAGERPRAQALLRLDR